MPVWFESLLYTSCTPWLDWSSFCCGSSPCLVPRNLRPPEVCPHTHLGTLQWSGQSSTATWSSTNQHTFNSWRVIPKVLLPLFWALSSVVGLFVFSISPLLFGHYTLFLVLCFLASLIVVQSSDTSFSSFWAFVPFLQHFYLNFDFIIDYLDWLSDPPYSLQWSCSRLSCSDLWRLHPRSLIR